MSKKVIGRMLDIISIYKHRHLFQWMLALKLSFKWNSDIFIGFTNSFVDHANCNSMFFFIFFCLSWIPRNLLVGNQPFVIFFAIGTENPAKTRCKRFVFILIFVENQFLTTVDTICVVDSFLMDDVFFIFSSFLVRLLNKGFTLYSSLAEPDSKLPTIDDPNSALSAKWLSLEHWHMSMNWFNDFLLL